MNIYLEKRRTSLPYRILSAFIAFTFIFSVITPPAAGQMAPVLNLPPVGTMVPMTAGFAPALVKGITIHPENPLLFDFIIDSGDSGLEEESLKEESTKLIKYFLASLTVPEEELWVNLSPYEKDRVIPKGFGDTEMGRDLLAQDYILKQLTASLMYPEDDLGKKFWDRVYKKAYEKFGTTEIPMNTFNKIWIVPEKAVVFEHESSAFVIESHLKVMLEEDYLALQNNLGAKKYGLDSLTQDDTEIVSGLTSSVVREVLIPEIEKEVNEGKNFANLRQIYNSSILATWYKQNLKDSLLGQVYVDKNKTQGVDTQDKQVNQKIYDQYVKAFKKGVYNYIREDYDQATQELIPRKYFSGGSKLGSSAIMRKLSEKTWNSYSSEAQKSIQKDINKERIQIQWLAVESPAMASSALTRIDDGGPEDDNGGLVLLDTSEIITAESIFELSSEGMTEVLLSHKKLKAIRQDKGLEEAIRGRLKELGRIEIKRMVREDFGGRLRTGDIHKFRMSLFTSVPKRKEISEIPLRFLWSQAKDIDRPQRAREAGKFLLEFITNLKSKSWPKNSSEYLLKKRLRVLKFTTNGTINVWYDYKNTTEGREELLYSPAPGPKKEKNPHSQEYRVINSRHKDNFLIHLYQKGVLFQIPDGIFSIQPKQSAGKSKKKKAGYSIQRVSSALNSYEETLAVATFFSPFLKYLEKRKKEMNSYAWEDSTERLLLKKLKISISPEDGTITIFWRVINRKAVPILRSTKGEESVFPTEGFSIYPDGDGFGIRTPDQLFQIHPKPESKGEEQPEFYIRASSAVEESSADGKASSGIIFNKPIKTREFIKQLNLLPELEKLTLGILEKIEKESLQRLDIISENSSVRTLLENLNQPKQKDAANVSIEKHVFLGSVLDMDIITLKNFHKVSQLYERKNKELMSSFYQLNRLVNEMKKEEDIDPAILELVLHFHDDTYYEKDHTTVYFTEYILVPFLDLGRNAKNHINEDPRIIEKIAEGLKIIDNEYQGPKRPIDVKVVQYGYSKYFTALVQGFRQENSSRESVDPVKIANEIASSAITVTQVDEMIDNMLNERLLKEMIGSAEVLKKKMDEMDKMDDKKKSKEEKIKILKAVLTDVENRLLANGKHWQDIGFDLKGYREKIDTSLSTLSLREIDSDTNSLKKTGEEAIALMETITQEVNKRNFIYYRKKMLKVEKETKISIVNAEHRPLMLGNLLLVRDKARKKAPLDADKEKMVNFIIEHIYGVSSSGITKMEKTGGINLNPAQYDLQIKRDPNGVPLPVHQQPIGEIRMNINGFSPVILHMKTITPVINLPVILGLAGEEDPLDSTEEGGLPELSFIDKYRNEFYQNEFVS